MIDKLNLTYTDIKKATGIYLIACGGRDYVNVFGVDGSYEWAIITGCEVERHSNDGYGAPEIALRDGLIAYFGLPDEGGKPQ